MNPTITRVKSGASEGSHTYACMRVNNVMNIYRYNFTYKIKLKAIMVDNIDNHNNTNYSSAKGYILILCFYLQKFDRQQYKHRQQI